MALLGLAPVRSTTAYAANHRRDQLLVDIFFRERSCCIDHPLDSQR
jgi:hypothetical protein